jgi:hypothetical protein
MLNRFTVVLVVGLSCLAMENTDPKVLTITERMALLRGKYGGVLPKEAVDSDCDSPSQNLQAKQGAIAKGRYLQDFSN